VDEQSRMTDVAQLARGMGAAEDEETRLQLAVEAAVSLVDSCRHAGITVNRDGECRTMAASDDAVRTANALQNELGEGPCHDPDRTEHVVVCHDLRHDDRWSAWGPRIHAELGVTSSMSVMIWSGPRYYGTLSLYADQAGAFEPDDLATIQVLAAHLAVSLAAAREIEGLGIALHSRTVIGQAAGILMERLSVDADQALAYLKRVSSHENRKLIEIAMDLVQTRELPSAEA
jgi:GAF domain-containing protein